MNTIPPLPFRFATFLLLAFLASGLGAWAQETNSLKVLFLYGARSHGPGAHEFKAGSMLLAKCLNDADVGIEATVHAGWPKDNEALLDDKDALIFFNDGTKIVQHGWEKVDALAAKGTGLMFMHYAVHPSIDMGEKYFKKWMGAYFSNGKSVNPFWRAEIEPLKGHETAQGVEKSETIDEYYHSLEFCGTCGVHHLGTATPTKDNLVSINNLWTPAGYASVTKETPLPLLWGIDREDGGRGAGFTGGHFHHNWAYDELRQLLLNTVVWVAGGEVPADGVPVTPLTEDELNANLDDYGAKSVRLALPSPENRPPFAQNDLLTVEQHKDVRKKNKAWMERKKSIVSGLVVPAP